MDVSVLVAKFLGPVMLVGSISMLLNRDLVLSIFEDFVKSPALIYIAGIMALVGGIALITFHNLWVADWRIIVTLFGWLALIGGVIRMVFPKVAIQMGQQMVGQTTFLYVVGALNFLLGAFLTYMGFLA